MAEKTVAAISTPLGAGGIGTVRISGDGALAVADRFFKPVSGKPISTLGGYRAAFGEVADKSGNVIDEGVALVFRAPKSYTGEDVVEITVHGGNAVLKQTLRAALDCGASPAQNGEFTKRAFLNGKMDLSKAESVMELIAARSDTALKISRAAMGGSINRAVNEIKDALLKLGAGISAFSDFPDEELEGVNENEFRSELSFCETRLDALLSTYDSGKIIREGIDCAIVGKPNVGKSTLMNMLCGSEKSIVTDIPGTTRDIVENTVNLYDITLNLADTAGIHDTDDIVESVGVDRARDRLSNAGLVLAVFDSSVPLDENDRRLLSALQKERTVAIINKSDLEKKIDLSAFDGFCSVEISAKKESGKENLYKTIAELVGVRNLSQNDAVLVSEHQRDCVSRAKNAVTEALSALDMGMTLDAVGVCADDAIAALLELTGERVTNAVTNEIFKRFCVGK